MKPHKDAEFVIFGYSHREDSGGGLVLHQLCDRLNQLGYRASFWPYWKPVIPNMGFRSIRQFVAYWVKLRFARFSKGPFNFPIARRRDLKSAIVLYPEVVLGNPLHAKAVVRWLLHRPGYHTGMYDYGKNDLFFFYNEAFNDTSLNSNSDHLLRVSVHLPEYKQTNFGARKGTCVLIRKGYDRDHEKHPKDAILLDNLAHKDVARILNQVQYMYSYDLHTYYCTYAALCGCIPIVIPVDGLDEEQWSPHASDRLGIAYGVDRIDWASTTRDSLLDELDRRRAEEDRTVHNFVAKCRAHFGVL